MTPFLGCASGWNQLNQRCFYLSKKETVKSFAEGETACKKKNRKAHLASIHSVEEQDFLRHYSSYSTMWIGGTDEAQEGSWTWSDGSPWDYQKWRRGEPNNFGRPENCLMMLSDGWVDVPCQYLGIKYQVTGFICSYSLEGNYAYIFQLFSIAYFDMSQFKKVFFPQLRVMIGLLISKKTDLL